MADNKGDGVRILYVEDDPADVEILREIVGGLCVVEWAETLARGVSRCHEEWDLVVLDYRLPQSTDDDVYTAALRFEAPVVILTGSKPGDVDPVTAASVDGVLSKSLFVKLMRLRR